MRVLARLFALLALSVSATAVRADIDQPSTLPEYLRGPANSALSAQRVSLIEQRDQLLGQIAAHDARCSHVRSDDEAAASECQASQTRLMARLTLYNASLEDYEERLRNAQRSH